MEITYTRLFYTMVEDPFALSFLIFTMILIAYVSSIFIRANIQQIWARRYRNGMPAIVISFFDLLIHKMNRKKDQMYRKKFTKKLAKYNYENSL